MVWLERNHGSHQEKMLKHVQALEEEVTQGRQICLIYLHVGWFNNVQYHFTSRRTLNKEDPGLECKYLIFSWWLCLSEAKWLKMAIQNYFYDHHFLWHVLFLPWLDIETYWNIMSHSIYHISKKWSYFSVPYLVWIPWQPLFPQSGAGKRSLLMKWVCLRKLEPISSSGSSSYPVSPFETNSNIMCYGISTHCITTGGSILQNHPDLSCGGSNYSRLLGLQSRRPKICNSV